MAKTTAKQIIFIGLLTISVILAGCANQLPPGGGDIDRVPPEIVEVYPPDGTTKFNGEYIELGFSEYVDKRSLKDALFISPAIEGSLELDWSGRYVRVYFPQPLKPDITYAVAVGTDVVDYNNKNRMAGTFNFAFSTGPEIDQRVISGRVYAPEPAGILLLAYKLPADTAAADTINPMKYKPDYISQTGTDGTYQLRGLAAASYRVFAVRDEFRDFIFQPDQDMIGMPHNDITLAPEDTLFGGLDYYLTKIDTAAPRLLSSVMTDAFHIIINFNEPIDSTYFRTDNFFVTDSASGTRYNSRYVYRSSSKPEELIVVPQGTIPEENSLYFTADTLKDKAGNLYLNDAVPLIVSTRPDTAKPVMVKTEPAPRSNEIDFMRQSFSFYFDDAFDTTAAAANITFTDTLKNSISHTITFMDDASFTITPQRLEPKKDYIITFNLAAFKDAAGSYMDTVYSFRFGTISGLDFTGASGTLSGVSPQRDIFVALEGEKGGPVYTQKLKSNGRFNFERVKAGKYTLKAFIDENNNGIYDFGYPFPFTPAEPFSVYPIELDLRPRWVQTDITFTF